MDEKKMEEKKVVVEVDKKQVDKVESVIDARTQGGPDAIGEAEEDRLRREREGRQRRGEHQDVPVAHKPVEPSVRVLREYKSDMETTATGSELDIARERMNEEEMKGAVTAALEEPVKPVKPVK